MIGSHICSNFISKVVKSVDLKAYYLPCRIVKILPTKTVAITLYPRYLRQTLSCISSLLLFLHGSCAAEHIEANDEATCSRRRRRRHRRHLRYCRRRRRALPSQPPFAPRSAVGPAPKGKLLWAWDGDGEEELKRQFCCDRRAKRSSLSLSPSLLSSSPPLCLPCPLSPRRRRRRRSPRSMRRGPRCCHLSLSLFDFNPSKLKAKIRHKRVSYRVRTLGSDGLVGLAEYLYDIIFSHFASTGYSQSSNRRNNAGSSRADSDVGRCPTSDCG